MKKHDRSITALLSDLSYTGKRKPSSTVFFSALLTFAVLLCCTIFAVLDILSIPERIIIDCIALILSILLFIMIFWGETGGDFFSFINIVLGWYIVMFAVPIFFVLLVPGERIKPGYWDMNSLEYSVWIVIGSLYSLCFGYKWARNIGRNLVIPLKSEPYRRRIICYVFVSIYVSLILLAIRAHFMGVSIWDLIGFREYGSELSRREYSMGIYTLLSFAGAFFSYKFAMCFILPRDARTDKFFVWCANLFILFYIINTVFSGIISTRKAGVFGIAFFLVALMHYRKRKVRIINVLALVLLSLCVLTTFNYARFGFLPRTEIKSYGRTFVKTYLNTFEDFETLCVISSFFPRSQNYYFGQRTFEEAFYLPIPRAIWKDKPPAYGFRAILYDINPGWFTMGYHTGLHGQFYADLGLPGVLIGFFVFGAIIRFVYNVFRRNIHHLGIVMLYIGIITGTWLYLKGGFPWFNVLIMNIIPFSVALCFIYPVKMHWGGQE